MYSNFLYDDKDAFSDLFVDVSEEHTTPTPHEEKKPDSTSVFSGIKSLFSGFGNGGMLTTLLLFYMLSDCDEDERLIILALYFLMGL
ncbi:MAG: hypothetical protein IKU84_00830 [Clostridia bacterium]|nr:hypothetical protein [Clostridia bacterium]